MKYRHGLFALIYTFWSFSALAVDTPVAMQARDMAIGVCSGCHGQNGLSISDPYPHLAGQKSTYLIKQLKEFRDGKRKDPIMNAMAAELSDEVIEGLALHFSSRRQP